MNPFRIKGTLALLTAASACLPSAASACLPSAASPSGEAAPSCRRNILALRTNMLADALLVPNIGAEFSFGERFSAKAGWGYAWWSRKTRHRFWRVYGGNIELRYFPGNRSVRNQLEGHHIGVYANAATYDFEFGGKGEMSPQWNFGAGISYGYSLPVAQRLLIDFSIGIGYFGGKYYEYIPDGGRYVWTATKTRNFFGPTKLEVSLVWILTGDR